MDAYVQFLRNALCTAKNFNFFGDTFLYDPKVTAIYYTFPSPLDETTPLELLISITQLYALLSVSIAGYKMITKSGVNKLQLISKLVSLRQEDGAPAKKEDDTSTGGRMTRSKAKKNTEHKSEELARQLVTQSLHNESDAATRSFFVGTNVLVLGLCFFWLFANSYHVTSTNWIGGIIGLIHALTIMEVNLIVFLYYMVKDAGNSVRKSYAMKNFAQTIETSKNKLSLDNSNITVEQYNWLVDGWTPFWVDGNAASAGAEEKMLTKEDETVASKLVAFTHNVDRDTVDRIKTQSRVALFEGFREYIYLVLNCFAFYGYLVCIIVFYYQDETSQPNFVKTMLFHMPNADADWLGNAVGDFAWTVEPVIILISPMIINAMSGPKGEKEKED